MQKICYEKTLLQKKSWIFKFSEMDFSFKIWYHNHFLIDFNV